MTYDTSENHRVRRKAGVCQFERHKRPSGAVANNQALCTGAGQLSPAPNPGTHEITDAMERADVIIDLSVDRHLCDLWSTSEKLDNQPTR